MIKSELVQHISTSNPHLYQRDVENIVNAILNEITGALSRGDRVELRGFGAFSVKNRPARTGRNPRTGAHVSVAQKSVPFFKTGKEMRERLNKSAPDRTPDSFVSRTSDGEAERRSGTQDKLREAALYLERSILRLHPGQPAQRHALCRRHQ